LNETAEVACVSPFYLSHVFAQVMGIPYSQYLNYIKINMAYRDLASTGDSILDILLRHGFNNAKTFNKAFKSQIGCSPSEYRKEVRQGRRDRYIPYPRVEDKPGSYVNFKSPVVMPQTPYRAYSLQTGKTSCRSGSVQTITIDSPGRKDCGIKTTPLDRYYLKMIGHSRAGDLLRKGVQEHFILVQKEIGFEYIRFFGIFDDEMCIITKEGLYNWTYVDEVFDFLAEIGLRPFVNFSFMPSARRQVMQRYFTIREMLRPLPVGKNGGIWSNLSCGIA
jgi:xylan 1,4-beta-xylosidase